MSDSEKQDLPVTLDRDALKLLFRNLLAQKAVRTSAGESIIKLAAVNKVCLDSIVRVTNQLGKATLTSDQIALKRGRWPEPAIVITRAQFVWMVQWEMLRLKTLTIPSKIVGDWHSLVEHFQMPSLHVVRYTRPFRRSLPGKHIDTSLWADIVKLNSSNIQELGRVPVWKLSEPLPPLHLKKFVYEPRDWTCERLDNLSRCSMDVLEIRTHPRCTDRRSRISLDFLADVDAKEIAFYPGRVRTSHFKATKAATNESVRRISVTLALLGVRDVRRFCRFFPNLREIAIDVEIRNRHRGQPIPYLFSLHEIGQYLASAPAMPMLSGYVDIGLNEERGVTHAWTAENVSDQYGRVQEMRQELALVPPQLEVRLWTIAAFHRVDESQTKEASKVARQLGFRRAFYDSWKDYELRDQIAPRHDLWILYKVSD